jgi:bifunctional non-homologous end joining protein LigD
MHKDDAHAVPGWDPEDHPRSVRSGLTNDDISAAPPAMWQSGVDPSHAEIRLDATSWDPPGPEEWAAFAALGRSGRWRVGGRELDLTNLDDL